MGIVNFLHVHGTGSLVAKCLWHLAGFHLACGDIRVSTTQSGLGLRTHQSRNSNVSLDPAFAPQTRDTPFLPLTPQAISSLVTAPIGRMGKVASWILLLIRTQVPSPCGGVVDKEVREECVRNEQFVAAAHSQQHAIHGGKMHSRSSEVVIKGNRQGLVLRVVFLKDEVLKEENECK